MKYIAFVDTETTGVNPDIAEVIELGIVLEKHQDNKIIRFKYYGQNEISSETRLSVRNM